ncbi:hypothetical protein BGW36DRAFT_13929 [Talaromyces proteolyticus]|uniref:Uncharacterized protein n=1 Tax=Talaromyces proteolyticus TaxID=1131652 RepID=A0AAD4Q1C0_9EURO|nr:uncharacterized protein BGW36DRAFT_13929 [Talaromyces proteolyticus]KAH8705475.1 hypothetical protein BGW36DRAFT_13929 [Talaromyces proteolyticus]
MDPDQPKKEDVGSRLLNRMSSVFRRKSRRTQSTVSNITIDDTANTAGSAGATASTPQPALATTNISTLARDTTPVMQWSSVQQERARALFAKYGLTLEPEEWMSPRNLEVQRVEKSIRMRVRRTCHRCQTTYGPDKVCANCQHVRCKKCPRYPPALSKEEKEARALAKTQAKSAAPVATAATATGIATGPTPAAAQKKQKHPPLTIPSRTGGQDLVYKQIRQRVRRTCHRCQTLFRGDSKECESCSHVRCKKCPRDPPKLHKYPDGYPGDADPPPERPQRVWRKPRMRVRYFCHQCDTPYIPGEQNCSSCGQEKGPETRRDPK